MTVYLTIFLLKGISVLSIRTQIILARPSKLNSTHGAPTPAALLPSPTPILAA